VVRKLAAVRGRADELLWVIGSRNADVAGFYDEFTVLSGAEVPAVSAHATQMGIA